MKEVTLNEFFSGNPELFTLIVDNLILMGVAVDGVGAGGSMEEIGKKVRYRYL